MFNPKKSEYKCQYRLIDHINLQVPTLAQLVERKTVVDADNL